MGRLVTEDQIERARAALKASPGQRRLWRDGQVALGEDPTAPFEPGEELVRQHAVSLAAREAYARCLEDLKAERPEITRLSREYDAALSVEDRTRIAEQLKPLLEVRVADLKRRSSIVGMCHCDSHDEIADLRMQMSVIEAAIAHRA